MAAILKALADLGQILNRSMYVWNGLEYRPIILHLVVSEHIQQLCQVW